MLEIPGWMPLPHGYHHCWRVEAGGVLYSRPLKGNQFVFFFSESPEKLKAPAFYWGGKGGGLRSVDTFFDGSFEIRRENPPFGCIKSLIKNGISTTNLNW